jgi:predicted nucleic-acid-binding protein
MTHARQRPPKIFVAKGGWVSTLVLAETAWVLTSVYQLDRGSLAQIIEMLLHHRDLVLQDSDTVKAALELFRGKPALGFSDCLVLESARKAGNMPLGTFDRALSRIEGTQRL